MTASLPAHDSGIKRHSLDGCRTLRSNICGFAVDRVGRSVLAVGRDHPGDGLLRVDFQSEAAQDGSDDLHREDDGAVAIRHHGPTVTEPRNRAKKIDAC